MTVTRTVAPTIQLIEHNCAASPYFSEIQATDIDAVSFATPDIETAQMLIEAGVGIKAPYFHRSWIRLPWDTDADEMQHRLEASYDIVRSGLTKKLQATLDPRT